MWIFFCTHCFVISRIFRICVKVIWRIFTGFYSSQQFRRSKPRVTRLLHSLSIGGGEPAIDVGVTVTRRGSKNPVTFDKRIGTFSNNHSAIFRNFGKRAGTRPLAIDYLLEVVTGQWRWVTGRLKNPVTFDEWTGECGWRGWFHFVMRGFLLRLLSGDGFGGIRSRQGFYLFIFGVLWYHWGWMGSTSFILSF